MCMAVPWWQFDDLACSAVTRPSSHSVDHELLCMQRYSRVKHEAICTTPIGSCYRTMIPNAAANLQFDGRKRKGSRCCNKPNSRLQSDWSPVPGPSELCINRWLQTAINWRKVVKVRGQRFLHHDVVTAKFILDKLYVAAAKGGSTS